MTDKIYGWEQKKGKWRKEKAKRRGGRREGEGKKNEVQEWKDSKRKREGGRDKGEDLLKENKRVELSKQNATYALKNGVRENTRRLHLAYLK